MLFLGVLPSWGIGSYLNLCIMKHLSFLGVLGLLMAFHISWAQNAPNDDACDAINLLVDGSVSTFNNFNSTVQPGEAAIAPPMGNGSGNFAWNETSITSSVWFTFTAPSSGAVQVDLCNGGVATSFDTQVAVYAVTDCNDFGTFTVVGANDDLIDGCPSPADEFASRLDLYCMTPGDVYYIMVDGWFSANFFVDTVGDFSISVTELPSPALNVDIDVIDISCDGANDATLTASGVGGGLPYDFTWTTPQGGTVSAPTLSGVGPGSYTISLEDACDSVLTETVVVSPPPALAIVTTGTDTAECDSTGRLGDAYTIEGPITDPRARRGVVSDLIGTIFEGSVPFFYNNQLRDPSFSDRELLPQLAGFPAILAGDAADGDLFFAIGSIDFSELFVYGIQLSSGNFASSVNPVVLPTDYRLVDAAYNPVDEEFYVVAVHFNTSGAFINPDTTRIFTVDVNQGTLTPVSRVDFNQAVPRWFAINNQGEAYLAEDFSEALYRVDLPTGDITRIGELGYSFEGAGNFLLNGGSASFYFDKADFDPETNDLYATYYNGTDSELRRVSVETGFSYPVGIIDTGRVAAFGIVPFRAQDTSVTFGWFPNLFLDTDDVASPTYSIPVDSVSYRLTIEGACGDQVSQFILVALPFSAEVVSDFDQGTGTGTAAVVIQKGTPPFTYAWNDPNNSTDSVLTGLAPGTYEVAVTDANGCTDTLSVELGTVSIRPTELGLSQFEVFPNPAHDAISIAVELTTRQRFSLSLLNMQGQVMRQQEVAPTHSYQQSWSLDGIAAGLYLLRIQTAQGQQVLKLSVR